MDCALFFSDMYEWPLGTWGPPESHTLELRSSTKWPSISIPWLVGAFVLFVSCLCDLSFDQQWKHWAPLCIPPSQKSRGLPEKTVIVRGILCAPLSFWMGALLHFEQSVSADDDSHVHRWQIIVDDIHSVWKPEAVSTFDIKMRNISNIWRHTEKYLQFSPMAEKLYFGKDESESSRHLTSL